MSPASEESEKEWLGATWRSWGCLSVLGSMAIGLLAIAAVIYGVFTTPNAFGPEGVVSPDPALLEPFDAPARREVMIGIPPVGVADFTTLQQIRLEDGMLFEVARTAFDWIPERNPRTELTVVEVRVTNGGARPIALAPSQFRMVTAWAWEGELAPREDFATPGLLTEQQLARGESAQGLLVFARNDTRQVRRYLLFSPPGRAEPLKVLLVASGRAVSRARETRREGAAP